MNIINRIFIYLILFSGCNQSLYAQEKDLIELREICYKAFLDENPEGVYEKIDQYNHLNNPVLKAYRSILFMLEAKNSFSPIDKIKYFYKGKNLLEYSISTDRACLEMRFLRFCVQTNIPFFLGYSGNIKEDKDFIIRNWFSLKDMDLKERIRISMINSLHCSDTEKKKFTNG